MGMRPNFNLIIGVTDLKMNDARYTKPSDPDFLYEDGNIVYWEGSWRGDKHYHDLKIPGFTFTTLEEIIYNANNGREYVCGNVTGLIIERLYDKDIFRALSILDKKYFTKGFEVIPQEEVSEWHKEIYEITDDDIRCNRVVDTVLESSIKISRDNWSRALFYLKQCGYDFKEEDLHYILVWDWS